MEGFFYAINFSLLENFQQILRTSIHNVAYDIEKVSFSWFLVSRFQLRLGPGFFSLLR